jgi:hypothetical protein
MRAELMHSRSSNEAVRPDSTGELLTNSRDINGREEINNNVPQTFGRAMNEMSMNREVQSAASWLLGIMLSVTSFQPV